jgi:hypothetical protein
MVVVGLIGGLGGGAMVIVLFAVGGDCAVAPVGAVVMTVTNAMFTGVARQRYADRCKVELPCARSIQPCH